MAQKKNLPVPNLKQLTQGITAEALQKVFANLKRNTMNIIIRKIYVFITLTIASFTGCKKEDTTGNGCKTDMQHISGTYKLTAVKYKPANTAKEEDYLKFVEDCEKDDLLVLNANGTFNYTDTGITCNPDGSNNGTWSVKDNMITTSEDNFIDHSIISSFDCRQLVLYQDDVITKGDRMIFTITKQ